jgi:hypothetical protein
MPLSLIITTGISRFHLAAQNFPFARHFSVSTCPLLVAERRSPSLTICNCELSRPPLGRASRHSIRCAIGLCFSKSCPRNKLAPGATLVGSGIFSFSCSCTPHSYPHATPHSSICLSPVGGRLPPSLPSLPPSHFTSFFLEHDACFLLTFATFDSTYHHKLN